MIWGKIEKSTNAGSHRELNPGHLACAASALPLSYDSWTTTSSHNPLYVLHRWDWNVSVAHLAAGVIAWSPIAWMLSGHELTRNFGHWTISKTIAMKLLWYFLKWLIDGIKFHHLHLKLNVTYKLWCCGICSWSGSLLVVLLHMLEHGQAPQPKTVHNSKWKTIFSSDTHRIRMLHSTWNG